MIEMDELLAKYGKEKPQTELHKPEQKE